MNLSARIFGVGIYSFLLIVNVLLIEKTNRRNISKILALYLVELCILAFFFKPGINQDLYRIFGEIKTFSYFNFQGLVENFLKNSSTPIAIIAYWIIGKIGVYHLLPVIAAFIFYINIFHMLNKISKKYNLSSKCIAITLLIIMCNSSFFEVISGIRTMIAFSFIARSYYDEVFEEKNIVHNLPFYLIACLVHNVGIISTLLRFFIYFVYKENKKCFQNIIFIFIVLVIIYYNFDLIAATMTRAQKYILAGTYNYVWENIITVLLFLMLIFIQKNVKKEKKINDEFSIKLQKYIKFIYLIDLLIIVFSFEHSIFFRFNNFNLMLSIPVVIYYLENNKTNKNYKYIVIFTLGILLLSCIRGNLSSLRFWGDIL